MAVQMKLRPLCGPCYDDYYYFLHENWDAQKPANHRGREGDGSLLAPAPTGPLEPAADVSPKTIDGVEMDGSERGQPHEGERAGNPEYEIPERLPDTLSKDKGERQSPPPTPSARTTKPHASDCICLACRYAKRVEG